jgi:transcriptional regulator with GAF, ATPase, and Fis domain
MLAQAIHLRDLVTETTRLQQSLRAAVATSERRRKARTRPQSLADVIRACERKLLVGALKAAAGNRAKAARLVSTTERIFNYKVRRHRIDWRAFGAGGRTGKGEEMRNDR